MTSPRIFSNSPQTAIRLQVGFSNQKSSEKRLDLVLPTWNEWYDLDFVSYPNENQITPALRHLLAYPYPDSIPANSDLYAFNPENLQAFYVGQNLLPAVQLLCEFAYNLAGSV